MSCSFLTPCFRVRKFSGANMSSSPVAPSPRESPWPSRNATLGRGRAVLAWRVPVLWIKAPHPCSGVMSPSPCPSWGAPRPYCSPPPARRPGRLHLSPVQPLRRVSPSLLAAAVSHRPRGPIRAISSACSVLCTEYLRFGVRGRESQAKRGAVQVARCQGLLLPWAQDPEIIVVEKFDKQLAIRLSGVHPYGAFADHRCVCNMNAVRSIESLAAGDGQHNLFRTLGPTLLISMAYIDLGKWLVAVDAGSQVWVRSCATGVAVQFLSHFMSISVNLYQHGHREKSCRDLPSGVQSGDMCCSWSSGMGIVVNLRTNHSVAVGFNLVFEHDDLITAICIASVVVNLLPYTLSRLDTRVAGMLNACVAGFTLLCFVLGLLISHPQTPVNMDVMFPKLSGESAYSLMALLGANIIAHNFYTHSSFVQVQRRSSVLTLGSLFHNHLFSILFIFTGIFLVNYILLSSAADESSATMVMNFQDAMELMHQIFTNPAAPIVLLVILLFSSHIISLTCIVSSDVISENFFGIKLPLSAHHLLPKGFAMILTICCAKVAGPGGIYQSLIMCPVIQAMLLPSSIIPILRVSSSTLLMGRYRVSLYVEILAFFAFLLALFTNIIFAAEILFGDSTWTNNLKGDAGSPVILPYSVLVLISCASIAFTLFLAVTPLKSASNES